MINLISICFFNPHLQDPRPQFLLKSEKHRIVLGIRLNIFTSFCFKNSSKVVFFEAIDPP